MDQGLAPPTDNNDYYFSPIEIKDEDGIILHSIAQTERAFWNEQDFNLTQVPELADPIGIEFPTNKYVFVDIDVWDYDDGATSNRDIDFVRSMDNMAIPFSGKQAGEDWTEVEYSNTDGDGQASLIFKYKIFECDKGFSGAGCNSCADNYYPAGQCTKFCEPQTNKYTCTSEGDKECFGNRQGAESECDVCTVKFYGDDCSHFCEESDSYVCNKDGSKACKQDYYPDGECTVFCTETSNFTCSEEGIKVCTERRKGHDCQICDSHYFGENCSTFCKPNEKYICSEIGEKICIDDTADPDIDCLKNNNILIIGIVAGIVILVFLVGSAILVCVKRGKGRNLEKGEVNTNVALTTMKSKDKVPQTGDPEDSEGIYSDLGGSADDENQSGISFEEKNVYIDADEDARLERIHGKTSIGKATKK